MLRVIGSKLRTCLDFSLGFQHSLSKLNHVCSAILCTLIEKGFCTPEETEDGTEVSTVTGGTGLGDGDTKDARDISHELENEDEILGTEDQKGLDNNERDDAEMNAQPRGIETEEDFQGKTEDVSSNQGKFLSAISLVFLVQIVTLKYCWCYLDLTEAISEDEEDQGDQQSQLEQEMGDVGKDGDNVDERLWDEDDNPDDVRIEFLYIDFLTLLE